MPRIKPQQIKPSSNSAVTFDDIAGVDDARGGAAGDRRVPARTEVLPRPGGVGAEGDPAARPAGHRQDAAGEGRGQRVQRAVLRPVGGLLRGDVRRPRRGPHPAPVRGGPQARTGDHLHRRARRRRRAPRLGHLRREGPDPQPAAGGDGRLLLQRARGRDRRLEPAREARPGAAAPGPLRPPGVRHAARRQGAPRGAAGPHPQQAPRRRGPRAGGPADQRAGGRRPGQHLQRGRDLRRPAAGHHRSTARTSTPRSSG